MTTEKMAAWFILVVIMTSLVSSCGDRSVVGTDERYGSCVVSRDFTVERSVESSPERAVYSIAVDDTGEIMCVDVHKSIEASGYSLSESQREMFDAYDIAVIDGNEYLASSTGADFMNGLSTLHMIVITPLADDTSWSCIKACAEHDDPVEYMECIINCEGKRPSQQ